MYFQEKSWEMNPPRGYDACSEGRGEVGGVINSWELALDNNVG